MKIEEMRKNLRGIFMLMVTPLKDNLELDLEGVRKNARFLVDNGIKGEKALLVPVAGGGEGINLSLDEHASVVETILDEVGGEVAVFPGVHLYGTLEAAKYCKRLQDMGVTGIQLSPPSSYYVPTDDDIISYFKGVAEAAPNLAIIVYNCSWEWGQPPLRDMTPDLIGRLLEIENFVGIKWGSKTLVNYLAVVNEYAGKCAIFNNGGAELLIPFHMMGGRGPVIKQVAPWYYLKIMGLLEEHKYAEVWDEIERWVRPWYRLQNDIASQGKGKNWVAIGKALVEVCGQSAGPPRPPATRLTKAQYGQIENLVKETGILEH